MINDFNLSPTEFEAYSRLLRARWPDGKPVCPWCGSREVYVTRTRKGRYACKRAACHRQFTVFTGTTFASSKMSYQALLALIDEIATGKPMLDIVASQGRQLKTVLVTKHKIVEAAARAQDGGEWENDEPDMLLRACLASPPSAKWKGYWQRSGDGTRTEAERC